MNRNAIAGGIGLAIVVVAWALFFGWFNGKEYSADPVVAELEKLRDENVPKMDQLSEAERRAQRDAFGERMKGLTEEQRMAFFESSMPIFVPMMAKQFEKRYDDFMAMSPEEQRKELDKRIDEMKARGGPGGPGGPGGGGNGGRRGPPNMDPKKAEQIRKKMLDWTTPEQRAKFENGINMMNGRLKERGMDPLPPGPGGGFF
jgi:hypothetical protein